MLGEYDHLNRNTPIVSLDDFAKLVLNSNYGLHRLLSAIVKVHKNQNKDRQYKRKLIIEIEKMLNEGEF